MDTNELFGKEKISKVLLKIAPPVMLAQLIQALYNIVDSLFVGNYSDSGLTALSIIYPIQLLMIALAVGTGVGINTVMAAKLGAGNRGEAEEHAGVGTPLAVARRVGDIRGGLLGDNAGVRAASDRHPGGHRRRRDLRSDSLYVQLRAVP